MKKKIVYNAEPLGYSSRAIELWEEKNYTYKDGSWNEIAKTAKFSNVEVLIVRLQKRVTREIVRKFPDLKTIISATTGLDHIDIEALRQENVQLLSLRGHDDFLATIPSTAEHTWALLLSLIRNIPSSVEHVKMGKWDRDKFRGYQLKDKKIGIVGLGRTGSTIARYAETFNMEVYYYDPYKSESNYEKVNSLEELFKISDIISVHCHLKEDTKHMINQKVINYAQVGLYLINTSRGQIIKEEDIVKGLSTEKIRGIATDVLDNEFDNISENMLYKAMLNGQNIIITPHIGGATWDAMNACEIFVAELAIEK